jgi:IS4 transposase
MDRGYNDYSLFGRWTAEGVYFVTRMKESTAYVVTETRAVPKNRNIISDEIIQLVNIGAEEKCPGPLRRVVVFDPENEREIVLLTNHLKFGATTISAIYKDRWKIELFFKALKQNLKVKTFVGTTENALSIQIWTALLALLLLKWMHYKSRASWSLSNLAHLLRLNLFTYRDLTDWLDDPFGTPPLIPEAVQLQLPGLGQPVPA